MQTETFMHFSKLFLLQILGLFCVYLEPFLGQNFQNLNQVGVIGLGEVDDIRGVIGPLAFRASTDKNLSLSDSKLNKHKIAII